MTEISHGYQINLITMEISQANSFNVKECREMYRMWKRGGWTHWAMLPGPLTEILWTHFPPDAYPVDAPAI